MNDDPSAQTDDLGLLNTVHARSGADTDVVGGAATQLKESTRRELPSPRHVAVADTQLPTADVRDAASSEPISLKSGDTIGKYQLIRELGRGGMGAVFLARDTRLGRRVAIKFLNADSQALGERLIAEARATARCNHDSIVVVYEAEEYRGHAYMVLEYLEGQTLRQLLEGARADGTEGASLPPERAVELMVPAVRALERAHEMGIVHRDLKPENVMLTRAGTIKVLDFGIAQMRAPRALTGRESSSSIDAGQRRDADSDSDGPLMTLTGALVGTVPYMSPEQLRCEPIDHRSDIWAVGIMFYELLTGSHPLGNLSQSSLVDISDPDTTMPRLSDIRPDLGALGAIVDRCLLKDPDDRTGSATQLLSELEPVRPGRRELVLSGDQNPFAGLAAYQEADAARFFGRTEDIANVVARVRAQPMVAVIGPSGVGKSSLIRAGVIPALKQSGEGWEAAIVRPGRRPLAALSNLREQFLWRSTSGQKNQVRTADLRKPTRARPGEDASGPTTATDDRTADDRAADDRTAADETDTQRAKLRVEPGQLGTEMRAWAAAKMRRVLVFVDQFEELFTLTADPAERQAFIACLTAIADDASSRLRVILSMRADFVEQLANERELLAATTGGMVFLSPIDRDGLRDALHKPIAATGYRFESEDMVEDMLDALATARGALPLLQFTASKLWDARSRDQRLLTSASYESLGGISGALARHADTVLDGMSTRRVALVRDIFQRLVTPERTRALASVAELRELSSDPEQVAQVLDELAQARLLLIDTGADDQGTVEIVHESLIGGWPRLRGWLDENQDDAEFLAKLRAATREWESSQRAEGLLWTGAIAATAQDWRVRYQGQLSGSESDYLEAVFARARRSVFRRRLVTYGGLTVLLLLVIIGAIALTKSQQVDTIREQQRQLRQQKVELQKLLAAEKSAREDAERATMRMEMEKRQAEIARDEAKQMRVMAEGAQKEAERMRQEMDRQKELMNKLKQ